MDTEKCAALLCALEEGTLARAADRLGYTPSGISRMIAALEEDVGFPLLYRGRSGVSATGECEALLPALRQMVYQAESCRQTAASLRGLEQGSITVGANYRFYARQLETESYIEIYPGRETDNSRILAENGVCPGNRFAGVEDDFSAMAMVEAGLGIALVNALIAGTLNGNVVFRPLDPPQYVEVGIATPPPEIMSPAARRFLNFVRENMEG